jgi:hypothetical protein
MDLKNYTFSLLYSLSSTVQAQKRRRSKPIPATPMLSKVSEEAASGTTLVDTSVKMNVSSL